MRTRLVRGSVALLAMAGVSLGLVASPIAAGADQSPKVAASIVKLTGAQENPPADPDGSAIFAYAAFGNHLCYVLFDPDNLDTVIAAHIHSGAVGVNGPIVVALNLPDPVGKDCITAVDDDAANSTTVLTQTELNAIIANPDQFYANVHTTVFPGGAVRAQLRR
jgi:CHRD domain